MLRTSTLLLLFLAVSPLMAKTYRWVDENGVTVYSQTPPPSGNATEMKAPPPPAVDPAVARQKLTKQIQQLEDNREDRQLALEKTMEEEAEKEIRQKNCQAAQHNLTGLQGNPSRRWGTEEGYKRLTDEERLEKMEEVRKQIEELCE